MNESLFRLLIESGMLQWVPRRGFPFEVDIMSIKAARHLERISHYYAKKILQKLRAEGARGVALAPWRKRDERLVTAVALQLWGEFQFDAALIGEAPSSLEATLYILTDLFPRPNEDEQEAPWPIDIPGRHLLTALTWSNNHESRPPVEFLGDLSDAAAQGVKNGMWPEEALAHWNRYLFTYTLRHQADETASSPHDEQNL